MGLKGQLEDLPLIDMLQIVAFSKKSGYLRIASPSGRGAVVLEEGRVLFAYSWSTVDGLRELARHPSSITPELIREHIEASLRELAGTREGSFAFELTDSISDELGGVKITPFILKGGLDPQELLLDLAVEIDNERQETTTLLELAFRGEPHPSEAAIYEDEDLPLETPSPAEAPPPAEALAEESSSPGEREPSRPRPQDPSALTVVLVDDESPVLEVVGRELRRRGYRVATAGTPAAGAMAVRRRAAAGERVLVAVDLKMPTSSERSFYGGFELIRRVQKSGLEPPLLLMVESLSEKARARAKELGVRRVVGKPTLTKLDPELYRADLAQFAETVAQQLEKLLQDVSSAPSDSAEPPSAGRAVPRPEFIAEMTKKLVEPRGTTDVSRIVLRVAERFLERGLLFVIRGETARGLSGFGFGSDEKSCAELAQQIAIEIGTCAPLEEVVVTGVSTRASADLAPLVEPLFGRIGRGRAKEAVFIPLLYNRATLLLLYGDNAATGRPIVDLSELELFVAQAGMALENKLLQRKLSSVDTHVSEKLGREAALGSSG